MRVALIGVAACLVAGCGRRDFDTIVDASSDGDTALVDVPVDASPLAGCVLYLAMDEASWNGTANEVHDSCNGLHAGTAVVATTKVDPVRGRVGTFGASACVTIPDAPDLRATTALTMSSWVRSTQVDTSTSGQGIITKRTNVDTNNEYGLFLYRDDTTMTKNEVWVDIDTANDRVEDKSFAAPNNEWHQITSVYDGSLAPGLRVSVYVDGALSIVGMETSSTITPQPPEPDVSVGCLPLGGAIAQSFLGDLDDVAMWMRPLDAAEVAAWYAMTTH